MDHWKEEQGLNLYLIPEGQVSVSRQTSYATRAADTLNYFITELELLRRSRESERADSQSTA